MVGVPRGLGSLLIAMLAIWTFPAITLFGQIQQKLGTFGESPEVLQEETSRRIRTRIEPTLSRHCGESCDVTEVVISTQSDVPDVEELGFEGTQGDRPQQIYRVERATIRIQIDSAVTGKNRQRLESLIRNQLAGMGFPQDIDWQPVTLPRIAQSTAVEDQLKSGLSRKLERIINGVIEQFCPDTCLLGAIRIDGSLISQDEASSIDSKELLRSRSGNEVVHLDNVIVELTLDANLPADRREQISHLLRSKTRFVAPLEFTIDTVPFPESATSAKQRKTEESQDPYGLNKLRETLQIFRELAGTKEIITTSKAVSESQQTTKENASLSTMSTNNSKENNVNNSTSSQNTSSETNEGQIPLQQIALYAAGILFLLGIIGFVLLRWGHAKRDAEIMIRAAGHGPNPASDHDPSLSHQTDSRSGNAKPANAAGLRLRIEDFKQELIQTFLDSPKIAKETFGRILQEEGVETAGKYLHLMGQVVVLQLLDDPNLSRDLYTLSEFYHKSNFHLSPEEELTLLQDLKTKVTANEIRVLTRKANEKFDFLAKLNSSQIFNLIKDESPQVQSIVLTQLDNKRRRQVFDHYEGHGKLALMRELSRAEAIPKEFLGNVAIALSKKVRSSPEFDTENLRSSEILLDLLEKSALKDQRALMQDLKEVNPEAARAIKLRLVTVELIPFLKSGQILELVLGMDRNDLLRFLRGTRPNIRDLLLANAPQELAESWIEQLNSMPPIDDENLRLVEMRMVARIRNLANNGTISLLDVNEMLFASKEQKPTQESPRLIQQNKLIA